MRLRVERSVKILLNKEILKWIFHKNKVFIPLLSFLILISILLSSTGVFFALASKEVIDAAIENSVQFVPSILYLAGILMLMLILRAVFQYLNVYLAGKVEVHFKKELYEEILQKEYLKIAKHHSGDLLNRLNSDISKIGEGFVEILPKLSYFVFRFVSAFIVLFLIDYLFALIILGFGLIVLLGGKLFGKRMKRLHTEHQESETKSRSFMQESIENMLVIKSFNANAEMNKRNVELLVDNLKKKINRNNMSIFASSGVSSVLSVGYFIAIIWGALQIVAGAITFGSLTAILQLVQQVQSPFSGMSQLLPKYYGMIASSQRVMEIEDLKDEEEGDLVVMKEEEFKRLIFDQVSFGYYSEDYVIRNLSMDISSQEILRLSGISGIGKSTILKLMLGLMEPNTGRIYLELKTGKKIPVGKHTRHIFTYVPQGNLILSGTVRDNIVFNKEDYNMNQVIAAAKVAEIDEFIKTLPNKYDTVLGERGTGLSEGQVQRLAIARALMSDGFILLFDEATSALDSETEIKILNNIKKLKNKTCVIVSHKDNVSVISEKVIEIPEQKGEESI